MVEPRGSPSTTVRAASSGTTAEDLVLLADDGSRTELVEGEVVRMTPAGATHGAVTARIGRLLDEYVEAHGLGVCCGAETGFILRRSPDTVRAPDAAVVVAANIPGTGLPDSFWPCAPDLAVEVVSPWDRPADVQTKVGEYFAAGTRLVWLVEPKAQTVRVYRSVRDVRVVGTDGHLDGGDVLPGFRCSVQRLFDIACG